MRSAEWARAAKTYLLPELAGTWGHRGALLYRKPVEWTLCYAVMQTRPGSRSFRMAVGSQLLAVPEDFLAGDLSLKSSVGLRLDRDLPDELAETETVMRDVAEAINREALPFFAEFGTVEAHAAAMEKRAAGSPEEFRAREGLCYARLLLGDVAGCISVAEEARRAVGDDEPSWKMERQEQVARVAALAEQDPAAAIGVLREFADWTCTKLRLPSR